MPPKPGDFMKKFVTALALLLSASTFANEVYTCTAGAGYDTLYLARSSVAKSRAKECAKEKCFQDGNRDCDVKSVRVERLVLSEEIYYEATANVVGSN